MTKEKKPQYVTKKEYDEEIKNQDIGISVAWAIGFIALIISIGALIISVNHYQDKEMYCAQNETVPYCVINSHCLCDKNLSNNYLCVAVCPNGEIYEQCVNRCLDWRWRDKA